MRQLIKHEFKDFYKNNCFGMGVTLCGYILYAIFVLIMMQVQYNNTLKIFVYLISTFSTVLIIVCVSPLLFYFGTIKKSIVDRIFSDEGYLTMSFPITTHQLILSKVISLVIWGICFIVINLIGISIMSIIFSIHQGNEWIELIEDILGEIDIFNIETIISLVKAVISLTLIILAIFTSYSLINFIRVEKNKAFYCVCFFLILLLIYSMLFNITEIFYCGLYKDAYNNYKFLFGSSDNFVGYYSDVINFTKLVFDMVAIVGMYFVNYYIIDKDLELD